MTWEKISSGDSGSDPNSHTHSNKTSLDKISENVNGLLFNGVPVNNGTGGTITDNSIAPRQTTFFNEEILNLYDKTKITTDRLIGSSNGTANPYTGTFVTDFIEVREGVTHKANLTWTSAYYDSNKQFISTITFASETTPIIGGVFTVPTGAKYVRLSGANANTDNGYLSENRYITAIHPLGTRQFAIRSEDMRSALSKALKPNLRGLKYAGIGDSISSPSDAYQKTVCENLNLTRIGLGDMSGDRYVDSATNGDLYTTLIGLTSADIITFMGGTNDIGNTSPMGVFTDRELTTFYGALHKTFRTALEMFPNAKIGVMSPIQGFSTTTDTGRTKALSYVSAIKEVAEYYNLPFCNMWAESGMRPGLGQAFIDAYMPDGGHPNAAGHLIMAKRVTKFIEQMMY